MKIKDIRVLQETELSAKLKDLFQELYKLNSARSLNQVDKPHKFCLIKKDIARIKPVINELKKQKASEGSSGKSDKS